jgi:hypothetical protein
VYPVFEFHKNAVYPSVNYRPFYTQHSRNTFVTVDFVLIKNKTTLLVVGINSAATGAGDL